MQPVSHHGVPSDSILLIALGSLATVVSFASLALLDAIFAAALGWCMAAISISDARRFIVPDILSLPAIPFGLLASATIGASTINDDPMAVGSPLAGLSIGPPALDNLLGMVIAAAAFMLIRSGYRQLRGREGLGLGDVKLAAVAGAWTGIEGFLHIVLLACITALIVISTSILIKYLRPTVTKASQTGSARRTVSPANKASPMRQTMETAIPFGAFLAPAIWLVYITRSMVIVP